jgi:hypothetical protein
VEWETKLEKIATEVAEAIDAAEFADRVPAGTLLEFFKGAVAAEATAKDEQPEVMELASFETENPRKGPATPRNASRLTAEDSWIAYWSMFPSHLEHSTRSRHIVYCVCLISTTCSCCIYLLPIPVSDGLLGRIEFEVR